MRGLAATRPLEGFPVSLLKTGQRSSPKLGDPPLEWIAVRRPIQPADIRGKATSGKVRQRSIPFHPRIRAGQGSAVLHWSFTFPRAWGTLTPGFM